jgi:hypothetical protein
MIDRPGRTKENLSLAHAFTPVVLQSQGRFPYALPFRQTTDSGRIGAL